MRVAIVSDVHSNTEALSAVLHHAEAGGGVDAVWCLGDIVGYGPEPSEVLSALRARKLTSVAGNHDLAAAGGIGVESSTRTPPKPRCGAVNSSPRQSGNICSHCR